ncbi:MAG: Na+/H+ antiporter NhaC family protein [Clostridia bacterium]
MITLILALFIGCLFVCALLGLPMLYAVLAGLLMFYAYGLHRGFSARHLLMVMIPGFRSSMIIVIVLLLIGIMSAAWRTSGLMALLVIQGLSLIYPPLFLLFVFLLCSAFSFILGSSLGSASVMGVMLFTLGNAAGVDPLLSGGAILSGIYFGDRASWLSSSAFLVATITGVDHKKHLRNMFRTSVLPFLVSAGIYAFLSGHCPYDPETASEVFALKDFFKLDSPLLVLPLGLVLLPAFTKLKLRGAIVLSTLAAAGTAIFHQGVTPWLVMQDLVWGYTRAIDHPQLQLLYGGGFLSMINPMLTVLLSGALPPLLAELAVLTRFQNFLGRLAQKTYPFVPALVSGILTSIIGCSQTLAIFLQAPLLEKVHPAGQNEQKALAIANTSIVLAALVPWNIAMAVPLAILGASYKSGLFAFYLYALPLVVLVVEGLRRKRPSQAGSSRTGCSPNGQILAGIDSPTTSPVDTARP